MNSFKKTEKMKLAQIINVAKRNKTKNFAFAAGLFALLFGGSVMAQQSSGGPIQATADTIEVVPNSNMSILRGHAEVVQDGKTLRSDGLRIFYKPKGGPDGGKIDRVYSDTQTFYVTPTEKIRGDKAVYTAAKNEIVFTGNVIMTQGRDVATGSELTINTVTKRSFMRSGNNSRVRAVFFPSDKK